MIVLMVGGLTGVIITVVTGLGPLDWSWQYWVLALWNAAVFVVGRESGK